MRYMARHLLPAAAAVAVLATSLLAQVPGVPPAQRPDVPPVDLNIIPGVVGSEEQLFINEAGAFSVLEYQMGGLALSKSSNASVQAYARRMMSDQSRLQQQLLGVVRQVHAAPPGQSSLNNGTMDRLTALSGIDFDRAYLNASVSNHEAAVASFQNESLGQEPRGIDLTPLVSWAKQTVPLLNDELTAGQALSESLGRAPYNDGQPPR